MARIYDEGGVKLTNVQVAEVLMNEMPNSHREMIKKYIGDGNNSRRKFAHAVLDAYKFLPTTTDTEEKSKKYCKFLMEKYMKSTVSSDGEESAVQLLISSIIKDNV